jgi:hypothetical protein
MYLSAKWRKHPKPSESGYERRVFISYFKVLGIHTGRPFHSTIEFSILNSDITTWWFDPRFCPRISHFLAVILNGATKLYWIWGLFLYSVLSEVTRLLDERCFVKILPCLKKILINFIVIFPLYLH